MTEPIRVLNLFTIMNRGGAETMVMNYYRKLDRSKVQFDFMVHRDEKGAYEDEIISLGGKIFRMIPIYPKNFSKYKSLLRKFFDQHPEYQIIHSHMSELGYFAFREAKAHDVKVIICHAHNAPIGFDLKMIMRNYFKKRMRPYITHMFMCGNSSGDWLFGKENEDKFIQMNNAIDASKFRYSPELEKRVKKDLGVEGKFVIGNVGRFNKQKNHEFLIDIFSCIQKIEPNSVLVLVGTGNLEESIKKKVKDLDLKEKVLFLGSRDDVNIIEQSFDVFLFPSLFEGLGIVLIEAQAAGIPSITSADVVPPETKVTDLLEYISLNENKEVWAKKVLKYKNYTKKDTVNEIIKNNFDINKNVKWLEEFYINAYKQ